MRGLTRGLEGRIKENVGVEVTREKGVKRGREER